VTKKINTVKNFNEDMTKRQQLFISLILKTQFYLSNKINKMGWRRLSANGT